MTGERMYEVQPAASAIDLWRVTSVTVTKKSVTFSRVVEVEYVAHIYT